MYQILRKQCSMPRFVKKLCRIPESASGVSKFSTYPESQENPVTVQAFFRKHGFSESQISKVMEANPGALTAKPEETLLPKFEFLYF
ncbi:hypothetical protein Ddye_021390 [Dipteronia dyeriana]|uniref:Uncharacterized protein n=1 Tax=Dipteronia dyeriana TaxID=168575 RepID=A0AAD9U2L7_9ROSI|nr:hypothetical protein Ddye_021390 [Dipteronia dyeriana]